MGSKTRLSSYCTKQDNDTVNLVIPRKTNARLARPIHCEIFVDILFNLQCYEGSHSNTEDCIYHPGVPIFHEGSVAFLLN